MKKEKTIGQLAKEHPDKSYRDLERYRDADRLEEAQRTPLTESRQKQEELEPIEEQDDPTLFDEDLKLKKEMGACITSGMKRDREATEKMKNKKEFKKEIDYHRYWKDMYEKEHKLRQEAQGETTIVKGIGMNSPEMKEAQQKIKELETILRSRDYTKQHDYKFLVNENKKLHKEVDEIKQDNKRLAHHIEDRIDRSRKAGM